MNLTLHNGRAATVAVLQALVCGAAIGCNEGDPVDVERLLRVYLTPVAVSLDPGATQQFTVFGVFDDGDSVVVAAEFAATGGTITQSGLYTAGEDPGEFQVTASDTSGSLSATTDVTINAVLSQVVMVPGDATLDPDETQQFATYGLLTNDDSVDVDVDYTATGGTITDDGLYTAGEEPGTYEVIATAVGATLSDTSEVTINPVGTLEVTVTGFTEGAPAAGTVSALPASGPAVEIPLTVPAAGESMGFAEVLAGSYEVTYTPPSDHELAGGETNPKSASVTANATTTVTFAVETVTPPVDVAFHSDFSTALGTVTDALLDTGQPLAWTQIIGTGDLNEVIPSTGLDFPTTNVLRVEAGFRSGGGAAAQTHLLDGGLPIPDVGESLYYRWYIRVAAPDAYDADRSTHPMQDGLGSLNWAFQVETFTDGTWRPEFSSFGSSHPNSRWRLNTNLPKNTTYRFEFQLFRNTSTTWNLHIRIYDTDDNLLYDDDDYENAQGSALLSEIPNLDFVDLNQLAEFTSGFNGLSDGTEDEFPFILYYQGGFCVRTQDWCGPYNGGI